MFTITVGADFINTDDVIEQFLLHNPLHLLEKLATGEAAVAGKKDVDLFVDYAGLLL